MKAPLLRRCLDHRLLDIAVLDEKKTTVLEGFISSGQFLELSKGATLLGNAEIRLQVRKSNQLQLRVQGEIKINLELRCARCLQSFAWPLDLEVERHFVAGRDPANSTSEAYMQEDLVFLPDGLFSPLRMVEEEFILELPMIPLCQEGCQGLCTSCGQDLNQSPCLCE